VRRPVIIPMLQSCARLRRRTTTFARPTTWTRRSRPTDRVEVSWSAGSFGRSSTSSARLVRCSSSPAARKRSPASSSATRSRSPRSMARLACRRATESKSAHPDVRYVEADIVEWAPDRFYNTVFFGFRLSHLPPTAFDAFRALVGACLRPSGRVAFVDADDRGGVNDESRLVGDVPVARQTLSDGRQFDVVKVFWNPVDLEQRLRALNLTFSIRRVGDTIMCGDGTRARA
jgi:hypothetical protein